MKQLRWAVCQGMCNLWRYHFSGQLPTVLICCHSSSFLFLLFYVFCGVVRNCTRCVAGSNLTHVGSILYLLRVMDFQVLVRVMDCFISTKREIRSARVKTNVLRRLVPWCVCVFRAFVFRRINRAFTLCANRMGGINIDGNFFIGIYMLFMFGVILLTMSFVFFERFRLFQDSRVRDKIRVARDRRREVGDSSMFRITC